MIKHKLITLLSILLLSAGFTMAQDSMNMGMGKKMSVSLTGAAEVPGPGDPDGKGKASVWMNKDHTQICYDVSVSKIAAATMAHIHEGTAGVAGPVVVTLMTPDAKGKSKGCADTAADIMSRIKQMPENFYVNVHNADFPDGAVRGQLGGKMKK